jgi:hypothetical protein
MKLGSLYLFYRSIYPLTIHRGFGVNNEIKTGLLHNK